MKLSYSFPKVGFQVTTNIKEMTLNFIENRMSNAAERSKVGKSSEVPTWFWILQCVIVTMYGNGHFVFIILTLGNLHTAWNWFVLSLSMVDLCVGQLLPSCSFICQKKGISCNAVVFFTAFNSILAIYVANTCLMTFDRYLALVRALKYQMFMTAKR